MPHAQLGEDERPIVKVPEDERLGGTDGKALVLVRGLSFQQSVRGHDGPPRNLEGLGDSCVRGAVGWS